MCMCCGHAHVTTLIWRSEDQWQEPVLSCHDMVLGMEHGHQAWQRLYPPCFLAGPKETNISEFGKGNFA